MMGQFPEDFQGILRKLETSLLLSFFCLVVVAFQCKMTRIWAAYVHVGLGVCVCLYVSWMQSVFSNTQHICLWMKFSICIRIWGWWCWCWRCCFLFFCCVNYFFPPVFFSLFLVGHCYCCCSVAVNVAMVVTLTMLAW